MAVCFIFLCYSVFLLINYFFSIKYFTFIFLRFRFIFSKNTLWSIARGRLRNYKPDNQGEEKGMSGAKS